MSRRDGTIRSRAGAERERRLARARYAVEHHEGVARYIGVNIFEVILARAANLHASGRPRMPMIVAGVVA
ncbi:MAG: hypothetical protein PGN12_14300 [Sphingomonas phyllosphaerae]